MPGVVVASVWMSRVSVRRLALRVRWALPGMAVVLVGSLAVGLPSPAAAADPVVPPGATTSAPVQATRSAALDPQVSTERSQGGRGGGATPSTVAPLVDETPKPRTPPTLVGEVAQVASAPREGGGFRAGVSTEDVAARTGYSTEWVNPDGTRTSQIFPDVAFVPDGSGGMRPVNTTLVRKQNSARMVPTAGAAVSFASVADDPDLATLSLSGGASVGFGVDGAAVVGGAMDGGVVRYSEVRPGADVELSATGSGVKESIVLKSRSAPTSWLFPLQSRGVKPLLDEASGSVVFMDRWERVLAVIPPGFMTDSKVDPRSGLPARSNNVTYTLVQQESGWALRVDLDAAWLADSARVYPVVVDPAYSTETDDTFVSRRDNYNRNNSADTELQVGTYDGGGEKAAAYLHFNSVISALPNKYIVSSRIEACTTTGRVRASRGGGVCASGDRLVGGVVDDELAGAGV